MRVASPGGPEGVKSEWGRLHLASGTNDYIMSWVGYFHVFGNDFDICFFIHLKSYFVHFGSILGARPLSYDTLGVPLRTLWTLVP